MKKNDLKKSLLSAMNDDFYPPVFVSEDDSDTGEAYYSCFLGSCLDLDPCGNYHSFLSANGIKLKCIKYWESLDKAAEELNGYISFGDDGDFCSVFFNFTKEPK